MLFPALFINVIQLTIKSLYFWDSLYIVFMKVVEMDADGHACGRKDQPRNDSGRYPVNDHLHADFFYRAYEKTDLRSKESLGRLTGVVLSRSDIWKADLNSLLDGAFARLVRENLFSIFTLGMHKSLSREFSA